MPRQESESNVLIRTDPSQRSELTHSDAGTEVGVGTKIDGKLLNDVASLKVLPATWEAAETDTQQLTADAVDANAVDVDVINMVTWASDDTDVATVDEFGVITAVGIGTCTITGTLSNVALGTHTDTVDVTVTYDHLEVLAATFEGVATDTQQETAEIVDANDVKTDVIATATWSSDDEGVATVTSPGGLITLVAEGTCTITGSYDEESLGPWTDTCAVTVNAA